MTAAVLVIAAVLAFLPLIDGSPMPDPEPTPEPAPAPSPVPATELIGEYEAVCELLKGALASKVKCEARLAAMLQVSGSVFQIDEAVTPPVVTVFSPSAAAPGFVVAKPRHESMVNWTPPA